MRKSILTIWPRTWTWTWPQREELIEPIQFFETERWVQEEEVLKLRLQEETRRPGERLQQLLPNLDLKRLIL